jgi:hypothetical protein
MASLLSLRLPVVETEELSCLQNQGRRDVQQVK